MFETRQDKILRLCQSMHSHEVHESAGHWNIGNIGSPDLIGLIDGQIPEQIGIDLPVS